MAISRAQLLKELLPGLNALFGMEYARYGEEHKELYETEKSERSFEEETKLSGFGAAPVKNEGSAIAYDNAQEAFTARYTHETIAMAFALTEEEVGSDPARLTTTAELTADIPAASSDLSGLKALTMGADVNFFDLRNPGAGNRGLGRARAVALVHLLLVPDGDAAPGRAARQGREAAPGRGRDAEYDQPQADCRCVLRLHQCQD